MPSIDLVIISDSKTDYFRSLTEQAIRTATENEKVLDVNVIVVEAQKMYYPNCITIHQFGEFSYNRYCNMGASWLSSSYIAFANNDLIFGENWASKIVEAMEETGAVSASAYCPISHANSFKPNSGNHEGYEIRRYFCGWLFVMRREYWQNHQLDDRISFWTSDDSIALELEMCKAKHILVTSATVEHINNGSNTLFTLPKDEQSKLCHQQVKHFNRIYNQNKWGMGQ